MDEYEIVRYIPDHERLTVMPIPPKPQYVSNGGTEDEWNAYWLARDDYYSGVELRKVKGKL